jgi:hypothetical protein
MHDISGTIRNFLRPQSLLSALVILRKASVRLLRRPDEQA